MDDAKNKFIQSLSNNITNSKADIYSNNKQGDKKPCDTFDFSKAFEQMENKGSQEKQLTENEVKYKKQVIDNIATSQIKLLNELLMRK